MKSAIFVLALAAVTFTSCTSAYKTGQTPDDVYFSPQRPQAEYVAAKEKDDDRYYDGDDYYSDRYLRMKVQNRNRWSDLDDYYYNGDRYNYSYNNGFYSNPWSANNYWNYYYNPYVSFSPFNSFYSPYYSYGYGGGYGSYYSPVIVSGPKNYNYNQYAIAHRPRMSNLNTYNRQLSNNNYTIRRVDLNSAASGTNSRAYRYNNNYRSSNSNAGNFLRDAFGGNNSNNGRSSNSSSNNNNSSSTGGRSSGSSSSSSSSGSSSSSAPVRKF